MPSTHKALDSPLTSAEGVRSEGWGSGLMISEGWGSGLGVQGGHTDEGLGFGVENLGFGV